MKKINPTWNPQRSNYRSRVKINGKDKAYFGGIQGGGQNPENKAIATRQIQAKIAIDQAKLAEADQKYQQGVVNEGDGLRLGIAMVNARGKYAKAKATGEAAPTIPLMVEMRELKEQLLELEKKNSNLTAQLAAVGQQFNSESLDLFALQEKYVATQTKLAKTEGKHASTICEYGRATNELMKFLAENKITTTVDLQQSSAVIGEYRDYWVDRLSDGECSHSLAKKSLAGARSFIAWLAQREYINRMPPAIGPKFSTVGTDESSKQFLTLKEVRALFKASSPRLQLVQAFGYNAGYRQSDLESLEFKTIDLDKGIILRQRSKTASAQPTKLWGITLRLLNEHLATLPKGADPFAMGYSNISREMSLFMREHVSQEPNKRSAKAFRSTAAQQLEILLKGKEPKTVAMFLAHGSKDQAKAYRVEDTKFLFESTDKLCKVFSLKD